MSISVPYSILYYTTTASFVLYSDAWLCQNTAVFTCISGVINVMKVKHTELTFWLTLHTILFFCICRYFINNCFGKNYSLYAGIVAVQISYRALPSQFELASTTFFCENVYKPTNPRLKQPPLCRHLESLPWSLYIQYLSLSQFIWLQLIHAVSIGPTSWCQGGYRVGPKLVRPQTYWP